MGEEDTEFQEHYDVSKEPSFEILEDSYIRALSKYPRDDPRRKTERVDVPLFHARRSFLSPEVIAKEGVGTYADEAQVDKEIRSALRHFGKEHLVSPKSGSKLSRYIEREKREFPQFHYGSEARRQIYLTTQPEECFMWASGFPSVVRDTLVRAGVPGRKIKQYLDEKYGRRVRLKLSYKPTVVELDTPHPDDLTLGLREISPEQIGEVRYFPHDYFIDKYRGKGRIRIGSLDEYDRLVFEHMLDTAAISDLESDGLFIDRNERSFIVKRLT